MDIAKNYVLSELNNREQVLKLIMLINEKLQYYKEYNPSLFSEIVSEYKGHIEELKQKSEQIKIQNQKDGFSEINSNNNKSVKQTRRIEFKNFKLSEKEKIQELNIEIREKEIEWKEREKQFEIQLKEKDLELVEREKELDRNKKKGKVEFEIQLKEKKLELVEREKQIEQNSKESEMKLLIHQKEKEIEWKERERQLVIFEMEKNAFVESKLVNNISKKYENYIMLLAACSLLIASILLSYLFQTGSGEALIPLNMIIVFFGFLIIKTKYFEIETPDGLKFKIGRANKKKKKQ